MEQPPGDYYSLHNITEKIHRVYAHPISAESVTDDDETEGRHVSITRTIPDTTGLTWKEKALAWHDAGFIPIPLKPGDKAPPLMKEWQLERPTREDVEKWWTQWPEANIGLVTGKAGGFAVIDWDEGESYEQHTWRGTWEEETVVVRTGRGYHVWYLIEEPVRTRNFPGVQIKGERSYVLAPGSLHPSGKYYERIDKGGDRALFLYEGAPRFLIAAVRAASRDAYFHISKIGRFGTYGAEFKEALAEANYRLAEEWGECRLFMTDLIDSNKHIAYRYNYCGHKEHPPDARIHARKWAEQNRLRIEAYVQPVGIELLYENTERREDREAVRKSGRKFRALLRKENVAGDTFEVAVGAGKYDPQWGWYAVCDGAGTKNFQRLARQSGFELCTVVTLGTPLETVQDILFHVYTAAMLWETPTLWLLWQESRKGKHGVYGVDDAKRQGGAKSEKKPAHVCQFCGSNLHSTVKTTGTIEVLRMVEHGEAFWYDGLVVVIPKADAKENGRAPPTQGQFGL